MEKLFDIVKDNTKALLTHVCNGKAYFTIETKEHAYQLEINTNDDEWKTTHLYPMYKAVTLMRWIREGIENYGAIQNLLLELTELNLELFRRRSKE